MSGLCLGKNTIRRAKRTLAPTKRGVSRKPSAISASFSSRNRFRDESLFDNGKNVRLAHDGVFHVVQLDLAAAVLAGQQVLVGKYTGTTVKVDGEEYDIVRQSDILAIVEE